MIQTLDIQATLDRHHPDICVVGEEFVNVHHCLLARTNTPSSLKPTPTSAQISNPLTSEKTPPRADLIGKIETIYSHPQAWGQCRHFLETYLSRADKIDVGSTSAAAAKVACSTPVSLEGEEEESIPHPAPYSGASCPQTAAIASRLAAEVYNLTILAADIEDRHDNQTRFLILSRKETVAWRMKVGAERRTKTLVHFRVPSHDNPGALADALAVFKAYGLSLTSMYTRPDPMAQPRTRTISEGTEQLQNQTRGSEEVILGQIRTELNTHAGIEVEAKSDESGGNKVNTNDECDGDDQPQKWRYIFFVEFENHKSGTKDDREQEALKELECVTKRLKVVGRWDARSSNDDQI